LSISKRSGEGGARPEHGGGRGRGGKNFSTETTSQSEEEKGSKKIFLHAKRGTLNLLRKKF